MTIKAVVSANERGQGETLAQLYLQTPGVVCILSTPLARSLQETSLLAVEFDALLRNIRTRCCTPVAQ